MENKGFYNGIILLGLLIAPSYATPTSSLCTNIDKPVYSYAAISSKITASCSTEVLYYTPEEQLEIIANFANKLLTESVDIDPEMADFVNDNFWELV